VQQSHSQCQLSTPSRFKDCLEYPHLFTLQHRLRNTNDDCPRCSWPYVSRWNFFSQPFFCCAVAAVALAQDTTTTAAEATAAGPACTSDENAWNTKVFTDCAAALTNCVTNAASDNAKKCTCNQAFIACIKVAKQCGPTAAPGATLTADQKKTALDECAKATGCTVNQCDALSSSSETPSSTQTDGPACTAEQNEKNAKVFSECSATLTKCVVDAAVDNAKKCTCNQAFFTCIKAVKQCGPTAAPGATLTADQKKTALDECAKATGCTEAQCDALVSSSETPSSTATSQSTSNNKTPSPFETTGPTSAAATLRFAASLVLSALLMITN
jgi:hypothetical protein